MKWIIWWLGLMIILPFLYLFWWKKRWQLLFGIIILTTLLISCFAPSEFAYSILTSEMEKEQPSQQLEKTLKSISNAELILSDSEKLKLEKSIIKLRKEIEKEWKKTITDGENKQENWRNIEVMRLREYLLRGKWVEKWGKKEEVPTLLFCGQEFNQELSREKKSGRHSLPSVESYNIIDFGQAENNKWKSFRKKLQVICQQEKNSSEKIIGNSPIIWLKNIDKITNWELKKELVKVVDPNRKTDLGKYQIESKKKNKTKHVEKTIDLSQFTLVTTTSTTNPKLSKELRIKLKHIEPFFDKHFWVFFLSSTGTVIIIFLLLIRGRKKLKSKSLKHLEI